MRKLSHSVVTALAASAAACGGGSGGGSTTPTPVFTSVQLSSTSGSAYQFGPTVTMSFTAIDQNGHTMSSGGAVPAYHSTSGVVSVNTLNVVVVSSGTPTTASLTADLTVGGVLHTSNAVGITTDLAPTNATVNVVGTTFDPVTTDIKAGGNVNWAGLSGGLNHNVDFGVSGATPFVGGSSAVSGAPGSAPTASGSFPSVGSFAYQCDVHGPAMHGTIVVH